MLPPPPSPGPENAPGSPAGPGVLGTRSTSPFPGGDGTKLRQGPGQGSGLRARPGARLPPLGAPGRGRRACSGQNSGTLRPRPRRLPLEAGSFAPGRGPWGSGCKPPPPQSTVLPGLGRLLHFLSTDTRPRPSTAWIRGAPPPQPTDGPPLHLAGSHWLRLPVPGASRQSWRESAQGASRRLRGRVALVSRWAGTTGPAALAARHPRDVA